MNTNNSNNPNDDSKDLEKIDADITKHRKYALGLIISVFSIFILYFCMKNTYIISHDVDGNWVLPKLSNLMTVESGDWGTFGDFIGGILNPIFALFAFYWLTYSVRLQIKELKDTRTELQKAANAQVETAQHQENIANLEEENVKTQKEILTLQQTSLNKQIESASLQQQQIAVQNFESLFFQLLKTKNDSLEDIEYKRQNYDSNDNPTDITELKSVDAIKQHIIDFKNDPRGEWLKYYEENMLDYTGSYFRICYQIVKLINQNEILKANLPSNQDRDMVYSTDQKKYFDIFRATLTKHEIEAFFFNCLNQYGNKKFKKLIEKYGLFEPLPIDHDRSNEKSHRLTRYAYQYEPIAFEENSSWENYFNEISKIDTTIGLEELKSIFSILVSLGIIIPSFIHQLHPRYFEKTAGFCYQFNSHIISKDIFNIFSEENLQLIINSKIYNDLRSNIFSQEETINNINKYIDDCISYFNKNNIQDYMDEVAPIGYHPENRKSINQLNQLITEANSQINEYKGEIQLLDQNLISIQETDDTLTAFILIKYGISYTEYCDFINSKQTIDNPPQQS